MDLRNNNITVGELLDNPKSRAVFQRRFGRYLKHPMVEIGSLALLAEMAAVYIPNKNIQETLQDLQKL